MSVFSDEDLKRLKKMLDPKGVEAIVGWRVDEWRALLARLEAAERVCENLTDQLLAEDELDDHEELAAWRKAAGR